MKRSAKVFLAIQTAAWACGGAGILVVMSSCGTANVFEKLEKKDDKDQAKKALQNGDYDAAIESLEAYLAENPNDAGARSMLANAYMKKVGIDVLSLAAKVTNSGADDWKGIVTALPSGNSENVAALQSAVNALSAIPAASRTTEQAYQLALAQASLAVTVTKKVAGDGNSVSDDKVESMSDADAELVYSTLAGSKSTVQSSAGLKDNSGAQKLGGLSDKISSQEGATTAEKTRAFLKSSN